MNMNVNSQTRRFIIQYDWWEAVVVIDLCQAADLLKECVEFWSDWERRLRSNKGDYAKTFVGDLAPILIEASMESSEDWLRNSYFNNEEGYCFPLNGSRGILLESCDEWSFDENAIDIREGGESHD